MTVNLSGQVEGNGSALAGVDVIVYRGDGGSVTDMTTGGDGLFSFDLDPGVYKLQANGSGVGFPNLWYPGAGGFVAAADIVLVSDPVYLFVPLYTSRFTLGGIPLRVWDYAGFDYPSFATVVPLISDGSSTINQALQTGSLPGRQATFGCSLRSWTDVQQLRTWNQTKETLTWVDLYGDWINVLVFDVAIVTQPGGLDPASGRGLWSYTMTLVEVP